MAQAVAYALRCPIELVTIADTSSAESPNGSDTGGSIGSETCVAAALHACAKLAKTLEPFRKGGGSAEGAGEDSDNDSKGSPGTSGGPPVTADDWVATVAAAGEACVPLMEFGWFSLPEPHDGQPEGFAFDYCTQGVCCAESEIDALSGESSVLRVDIAMDQGCPLNPLVDLGQVEGALIMSLGYFLTEEVAFGAKDGAQLTLGSWEYKVPAVHDVPLVLNVQFVRATPNPSPAAVLGSKASGEPAMALGAACALAVRDAIRAVRVDGGLPPSHDLTLPLTVERVQMACGVSPERFVLQ